MTSFEEGCQPDRVGSPLSIRSLSEDLQVAHQTVARWLTMLENLYVCFRIPPFGAPRIRAVKKETKLYLWDWSQVPGQGERFENLVACHLLKYCHHQEDTEGYRMELRFIRDTDRWEVDFIVLRDGEPLFGVECKSGEKAPSPAITYFRARTGIQDFYQVHPGRRDYLSNRHGRPAVRNLLQGTWVALTSAKNRGATWESTSGRAQRP